MAFDEALAARVRRALEKHRGVTEKPMFGGLCFLVDGKMACGLTGDDVMLRLGPGDAAALKRPHVRPMDFTGRPLKGYVYVGAAGVARDAALAKWVAEAVAFVRTVPARKPSKRKRPPRRRVAR